MNKQHFKIVLPAVYDVVTMTINAVDMARSVLIITDLIPNVPIQARLANPTTVEIKRLDLNDRRNAMIYGSVTEFSEKKNEMFEYKS